MTHHFQRIALAALCACLVVQRSHADVVTDWNAVLLNAIKTTNTNPPRASRAMAMVHCAVYDAVNAIHDTKYVPYAPIEGKPKKNASDQAAAAAAAHRVLVNLYPQLQSSFDAALAQSLQGIPNNKKTKGVAWGSKCADAVLQLRANDGASAVVPYSPPSGAGFWQPTPPANAAALLPNWPLVTCWTMDNGAQFRPGAPPALNSAEYTAAFNQVKELGAVNSLTRTADQTEIALFWADGGGTVTPPGHWNQIASQLMLANNVPMLEKARLFAMLNCAMADAAINSWDAKYVYSHWRPITGIRLADADGNDATTADTAWTPLIGTPPFPAYTSGHSTFSASAASVLADFFETDAVSFSTTSDGLPGVTRSFTSFSAAADEAGQSRIYGGIHWIYDSQIGLNAGSAVADHLLDNFFGLLGDLNHDGQVNFDDALILMDAWGACGGEECSADLNGNGIVNNKDLHILFDHFTDNDDDSEDDDSEDD